MILYVISHFKGSDAKIQDIESYLFIYLAFAGIWDFQKYKVPNKYIIFGLIVSFFINVLEYGIPGVLIWLLGVLVPIVVFYLFFYLHILGAGDIKLFSVIGGWIGLMPLISSIVYSFLIGAVFSIIHLTLKKQWNQRFLYFFHYLYQIYKNKEVVPYYHIERQGYHAVIPFGVCIALGTVAGVIWPIFIR